MKVKPGLLNYVLAYTLSICTNGVGLVLSLPYAKECFPNFSAPADPWWIAYTLLGIAIAYALGMFTGLMFLLPLLMVADKVNGGPFSVGDRVMILAGPHRGAVGEVYETWPTRRSVRVCLGEEEKKKVTDVFDGHKVWRCPK